MNPHLAKPARAFTLVELLVVVTILAVLVALLLPALGRAQDRAKTSACANNQRQVGIGLSEYLGDNAGYYPYLWVWPPASRCPDYYGTYSWLQVLGPYLGYSTNGAPSGSMDPTVKNVKILQCPSNPWSFIGSRAGTSYGINSSFFPCNFYGSFGSWVTPMFCTNGGIAISPAPPEPGSGNMGFSKRANISDIDHPSQLMLAGEVPVAPGNYQITSSVTTPASGWPGGNGFLGINFCEVTNMSSWQCGSCLQQPYNEFISPSFSQTITVFHSLSMNVLFPDNHGAAVSKSTLIRYSLDVGDHRCGETNASPGWVFWDDLKPSRGGGWFWYRFPGAPIN